MTMPHVRIILDPVPSQILPNKKLINHARKSLKKTNQKKKKKSLKKKRRIKEQLMVTIKKVLICHVLDENGLGRPVAPPESA